MLKINTNETYDYENSIISDSLGIIVHHEHNWRETNSYNKSKKLIYLINTILSLYKIVEEINLYVCDGNFDFLHEYFNSLKIIKINVPCVKQELRSVFPVGKYALMQKSWSKKEITIFTESDQILYLKNYNHILKSLDGENYFSPHRLEKKYRSKCRLDHPTIFFNKDEYTIYNHYIEEFEKQNDYIKAKTFRSSYGACWIAKKELLNDIDFDCNCEMVLESPCKLLFDSKTCLKTKIIYDFFVDHLSGYDNSADEYKKGIS